MFVKVALVCILAAYPYVCEGARYGCYANPTSAIPGCSCTSQWVATDYVYKTVVTCQGNVGASSDFKDNLRKLDGYKVDDFIITAYPNTRLPEEPFTDKTEIKRIIIQNSPKLEGFGPKGGKGIFANLGKSLKSLVVANNPAIRDDEWATIATSLANGGTDDPEEDPGKAAGDVVLNNLVIQKQTLFDDLDAFTALTTLEILVLRGTGFTSFKYDLTAFTNLQVLDLSETPALKKFELSAALPANLKTIFLSGGKSANLDCNCDNLPTGFVSEANEKRFLGATCGKPDAAKAKAFGSFCVQTDYFMSMAADGKPQMSRLYSKLL
ncbi:unnamed protein product [Oppiella nova]|uniref:Uncharacterized protein n=1 Tax=Oppiella nova TaxID=334625 RepID=A0A7R9LY03_9ACAR|nr:unnamed protein product [Oppiella nova]CAG2168097.1 unnamed protein product [Oppiella nova]